MDTDKFFIDKNSGIFNLYDEGLQVLPLEMAKCSEEYPFHGVSFATSPFSVTISGETVSTRQEIVELNLQDLLRASPPAAYFFEDAIPNDVRENIIRLRGGSLGLLKIYAMDAQKGTEIISELLERNPNLAFILAHANVITERSWTVDDLYQLSFGNDVEILGALGFPKPKSFAKMLRTKIRVGDLDFLRVRTLLKLPHTHPKLFKTLTQVDMITWRLLDAIIYAPDLLERIGHVGLYSISRTNKSFEDTKRSLDALKAALQYKYGEDWLKGFLGGILGKFRLKKTFPIRSYEDILHHATNVCLSKHNGIPVFPLPPFEGIEGRIIPIRDFDTMIEEGRDMDNCIKNIDQPYWLESVLGLGYAYRIIEHGIVQRALLYVRWNSLESQWEIIELEIRGNKRASFATREYADDWLDSAQLEEE